MPRVATRAIRMCLEFYRGRRRGMLTCAMVHESAKSTGTKGCALAAVGLGTRQHACHLAWRRLADGGVLEPARDVIVSHALPSLDLAALGQNAFPVPRQVPERFERGMLPYNAAGHYQDIAHRNGKPVAPVEIARNILRAQQEPVLHRMHVYFGWQSAPLSGQDITH